MASTFRLEIAPDLQYAGGWRCSFLFADGRRNSVAAPDEREARRFVQAYMRRSGLTLVRHGEFMLDGGMTWEGEVCG